MLKVTKQRPSTGQDKNYQKDKGLGNQISRIFIERFHMENTQEAQAGVVGFCLGIQSFKGTSKNSMLLNQSFTNRISNRIHNK